MARVAGARPVPIADDRPIVHDDVGGEGDALAYVHPISQQQPGSTQGGDVRSAHVHSRTTLVVLKEPVNPRR